MPVKKNKKHLLEIDELNFEKLLKIIQKKIKIETAIKKIQRKA